MSVLQTESDFEDLAYGYFRRAKKDGVVHAEVFFGKPHPSILNSPI